MIKKHLYIYCTVSIILLLLSACGGRSKSSFEAHGEILYLDYAKNLSIVKYDGYTKVELRNPWDTLKVLNTYILVDKNSSLPDRQDLLSSGVIVRTPLERAVVYSAMHCRLLDELGVSSSVKGVCDLEYIKVPYIIEGYEKGDIIDCGKGMAPDIERIIDLRPDAIMLSPFQNNNGYGRVGKIGVPVIECADYMETSPLGRAEWMIFYGLLTGREAEARALFTEIRNAYEALSRKARSATHRPTVLCELKIGAAWYIPGGNSTTGRLMEDAGAKYIFSDLRHSGSEPLPFETVFERGQNADFWIFKYNQEKDKTYDELRGDFSSYAHFKAFKEQRMYGCNTRYIHFYEETPFHPEALLCDMVKIFHPELMEGYELSFFKRVTE